jgi:uncharacterized protein YyaL (SSP411 family)
VAVGRLFALVALALPLPSHATLVADRASFGQLAEQGLVQTTKTFWNARASWYGDNWGPNPPVATLWSSYPVLELATANAIADPTPANKQTVDAIFKQAEAFWDPTINGTGGVSYLYGLRYTGNAYLDDAGWWGVSYLDAYRATGNTRWLWDAGRALAYIDRYGWDKVAGGMWWDTGQNYKTSEPLAAATLIAATLYRIQHKVYYLNLAKKYLVWADTKTLVHGLYGRSATDATVMDYVEGMMISAHVELCAATKQQSWCDQAEDLAKASLAAFPLFATWAPETDVVYLRGLLDLYASDGNPDWYAVAYLNGQRAASNARDENGFWSRAWSGGYASQGSLLTQAGTLELFGWLAATPPP